MFGLRDIKSFLEKCVRVWHILKKPGSEEFKTISKVSALGVLLVGFLGFVISVIMNIFK